MILFTCKRQYSLKQLAEIAKEDNVSVQDVCINNKPLDPISFLSPFTVFSGGLPVLGYKAASVDGIWQGMKLLKGEEDVNVDMIEGRVDFRKVKGKKPLGHLVDGLLINTPGEARRKVYVPAYNALLQDKRSLEGFAMLDALAQVAEKLKRDLVLVDWDINGQIDDGRPFAHAALLAALLNKRHGLTHRWSKFESNTIDLGGISLYDPIAGEYVTV